MKLLITGAWDCTKEQLNTLERMGHSILFMQYEKEQLPLEYEDVEGIVCNGLFLHHDIRQFPKLKYIQLTSAGFDRVPMDYVKEQQIAIFNARGVYSVPMAEFAISGVLALYKQSKFFFANQKAHTWEKHRGLLELYGKNVTIVGCGSVGTECAKRFAPFGCQVTGVDLYPYENESYQKMVSLDRLDEVLRQSDVVVLTLPLTEQTQNLFCRENFEKMKQNSVLVNIARGAVVNHRDLVEALENKLLGAVLDVFDVEPLTEDSPLWDMENVILTPHNSFVGEGNKMRLCNIVFENLECFQKEF